MQTKMFMWRWQHTFQTAVTKLLENILQILELPLAANVFVVGIPIGEPDVSQILFHDDNCGFVADDFKMIFSLAKQNLIMTPNSSFQKFHPSNSRPQRFSLSQSFAYRRTDYSATVRPRSGTGFFL